MQKLVILLLLLIIVAAAYGGHALAKRLVDPRRSFGYFLLFVLVNLALVFILSLAAGLVIFRYKEFFFKG